MSLSPDHQIARAHAVRARGNALPPDGLPADEILDSWARCMQAGLDSAAPIVVPVVEDIDLRLRREQSLAVGTRLPVARETAANPWAATTPEQRVQALEALIEAELPKAVKGLVAP